MYGSVVLVCLLAIAVGFFVASNPLLVGLKTGISHDLYKDYLFQEHSALDSALAKVRDSIPDDDFVSYRNHCLRVMSFASYHLPKDIFDEFPNAMNIIGMALAFHDVALWTDGKLDYLEPSAQQMEQHTRAERGTVWTDLDIEVARQIIMEHHKFTTYKNSNNTDVVNAIVDAVRKGDWADATVGVVRFDLPATLLEAAYETLPESGFHNMLAEMGPRLSPDSLLGQLDVLKILRW